MLIVFVDFQQKNSYLLCILVAQNFFSAPQSTHWHPSSSIKKSAHRVFWIFPKLELHQSERKNLNSSLLYCLQLRYHVEKFYKSSSDTMQILLYIHNSCNFLKHKIRIYSTLKQRKKRIDENNNQQEEEHQWHIKKYLSGENHCRKPLLSILY